MFLKQLCSGLYGDGNRDTDTVALITVSDSANMKITKCEMKDGLTMQSAARSVGERMLR